MRVSRYLILLTLTLNIINVVENRALFLRKEYQYGIVIDAGSSHSEVILYKWPEWKQQLLCTGIVEQVDNCEIEPGISSYVKDNETQVNAGKEILECISKVIRNIEKDSDSHIEVHLAATAGMRLAEISNPESKKIFITIRHVLSSSKPQLKVEKVDILKGEHEGLFAWITNNYVAGNLLWRWRSRPQESTIGVLDMGGASAQIAYRISSGETVGKNDFNVKLYGRPHTVHTFSNLCFGMDQARLRYYLYLIMGTNSTDGEIESPCHPKNMKIIEKGENLSGSPCLRLKSKQVTFKDNYTFMGTGDADKCSQIVDKKIVNEEDCQANFVMCFKTLDTSPPQSKRFVAISSYFQTVDVLELGKPTNVDEYKQKMTKLCDTNVQDFKDEYKRANEKYIDRLCFQLNFIYSTLKNIYKFGDNLWPNLEFANKINGTGLGWSLGLMINATSADCYVP